MLAISFIGLAVAVVLGRHENEVSDFDEREIYHEEK